MVRMSHSLDWLSWSAQSLTTLVASVITLILTVGWASAIGLTTLSIVALVNIILGRLGQKQARDSLEAADKRLGIMAEIIDGIKAIKLCGALLHSMRFMRMHCRMPGLRCACIATHTTV